MTKQRGANEYLFYGGPWHNQIHAISSRQHVFQVQKVFTPKDWWNILAQPSSHVRVEMISYVIQEFMDNEGYARNIYVAQYGRDYDPEKVMRLAKRRGFYHIGWTYVSISTTSSSNYKLYVNGIPTNSTSHINWNAWSPGTRV